MGKRVEQDLVQVDIAVPFVAVVSLARPPVHALNREMREIFIRIFESLQERDDVRAVVLTGQGNIFCAGADLKEKQTIVAGKGDYLAANRLTRDGFFCVYESAKPVIAAVNGPALGAGFVLAACCDMIFASENATFAMPEIDVGQGGGASFLRRVMPPSKMRRMMLTGERVGAAEFYRLGIVEACLPQDQLLPAAIEVASTIASKSPTAVRTIRSSFATVEGLDLREGFRIEQVYTTALSRSADAAEARRAFVEKRKPEF
jgi:enoyl-CoA hydratase